MNVRHIDAHCHLQFEQYDEDREDIIKQMREQGIASIVVGTDLESSKKAVTLAEAHEHLFASIGLHPNRENDEWFKASAYRSLAQSPKVVAIGECGLDYFRLEAADEKIKEKQKSLLNDHLTLAAELDKPLIIHARPSKGTPYSAEATKGTQDAYHDLIEILEEAKVKYPNLRGDIHFFAGGIREAKAFIALNFTISFTAVITFAREYDEIIGAVPLTSILSETDAPYVAPASRRGKRNDPLAIQEVVAKIADIRGEDLETIRTALLANAQGMFAL